MDSAVISRLSGRPAINKVLDCTPRRLQFPEFEEVSEASLTPNRSSGLAPNRTLSLYSRYCLLYLPS